MWDKTPDQTPEEFYQPEKPKRPKQIIGRRERVDFPDLNLSGLIAKIDTGAYTTALHCSKVHIENGDLVFHLLDEHHPEYEKSEFRFQRFDQKLIKNSFGEQELRYIIRTRIRMGKRMIRSIVSLSDRGNMRHPVLIGRRLLRGRFLVDAALENVLSSTR
jgi:hypothetical protein